MEQNMEDLKMSKDAIRQHYAFSNDVVGVFGFGMGISALASDYPAELASLSLVFILIWVVYSGYFNRMYKHFKSEGAESKRTFFDDIKGLVVYLLAFVFLAYIATGVINIESLKGLSLRNLFGL